VASTIVNGSHKLNTSVAASTRTQRTPSCGILPDARCTKHVVVTPIDSAARVLRVASYRDPAQTQHPCSIRSMHPKHDSVTTR
jgi:hypothetical protein